MGVWEVAKGYGEGSIMTGPTECAPNELLLSVIDGRRGQGQAGDVPCLVELRNRN